MRDDFNLAQIGQLAQDDHEFVPAQPRHRIRLARRADQPPTKLADQFIAGGVAERVVHRLEAVEVEQDHREALAEAGGPLELLAGAQLELPPVPQAGQTVGERQPAGLVVEVGRVDGGAT